MCDCGGEPLEVGRMLEWGAWALLGRHLISKRAQQGGRRGKIEQELCLDLPRGPEVSAQA